MLSAILGIVLLGTLYPLLTEAFGEKVSVGPPYFNPIGAIFFVPMLLVMAVGPLLRWRDDRIGRTSAKLALPALAAAIVALGLVAFAPTIKPLPFLGMALAAGLAVASVLPLIGRDLRRTPLPVYGMVVSHLGIAVALFGVGSDSAFSIEKLVASRVGGTHAVGPWKVTLRDIEPVAGPNWTALEAQLSASYEGGSPSILRTQSRNFTSPPQQTNESALHTRWNGQLYAVLGEQADAPDGSGVRWQLRLWWKPFVPMIWYGGLLVGLGGLLALIGRVGRDMKRTRAEEKIAYRRERQGR